ncbi:hypothetical protein E4T48_01443 [Aureobasidium sp. EXF-10727]|nr:hypothetical protein E4T48_01443 [Aureobasidium sp. EXF-10727]
MDTNVEAEEALLQQQLALVAQLQADEDRLKAEEVPFEELEWQYFAASGAIMLSKKDGEVPPDEQKLFDQLQEQYINAKKRHEELKQLEAKQSTIGIKRRKTSSSPIFVQQDESDYDEAFDPINASTGSKRKLGKVLDSSSGGSKPVGMTQNVKACLRALVAEAPAEKKQAAIRDSARVLQTIKQFRPGSVKYLGEGAWSIEGMATSVKTHQLINVGWMHERETSARGPKGGILGDKMGLGKTLCALASMVQGKTLLRSQDSKTNLVVVPKALKDQWMNEAATHTVDSASDNILGFNHIHAYNPETGFDAQKRQFKKADLVVATYPEIVSAFKDVKYPRDLVKATDAEKEKYFNEKFRSGLPIIFQFKFRAIYLDEGHQIRNGETTAAAACQRLMSKYRWVLTGTPMTNDPTDLYSVLTFIRLSKVIKLTFKEFKVHYRGTGNNSRNYKRAINFEWVATLLHESMRVWAYEDELFGQKLTDIPDPIMIDLCKKPSVLESIIYSVIRGRLEQLAIDRSNDPDTTKAYTFVAGLLTVLRQMTGHVLLVRPEIFRYMTDEDMDTIHNEICDGSMGANIDPLSNDYIMALTELRRSKICVVCKQAAKDLRWAECNHAYCYRCLEDRLNLTAELDAATAHCALCELPMSVYTDQNKKSRWLNESGKVIPSTKSALVVDLLKGWRDPETGDPKAKAVVFTTFKDFHKLLADTFTEQKWNISVLRAEMNPAERAASVKQFDEDPNIFIMLATSGVGGLGLNLMAARYLINYDQYFNESTELQARGRVVRIGQTKEATIVSLTATGTVDEHVKKIKSRKIADIGRVENASKRKKIKALLKMFKKAKKDNDVVELDSDDEFKFEDEVL